MFCTQCGLRNPDTSAACGVCSAALPPAGPQEEPQAALTDVARYPLRTMLTGLAGVNPLLLVIVVPVFVVRWALARLTRAPLLTPILASVTPRYETTDLGRAGDIDQRSLAAGQAWFTQQGFEQVLDIEDLMPAQGAYRRIMVDRRSGVYASITLSRLTRRVQYQSFFAFGGGRYFSVDNAHSMAMDYPANLVVQHVPGLGLAALRARLQTALDQHGARGTVLDAGRLMQALYQVGRYSVQIALSQGRLVLRQAGARPGLRACHYHPTDIAVRACAVCGKPLCEVCHTLHEGKSYCRSCLPAPQAATGRSEGPGLPPGIGFAGLGVRMVAGLLDLLVAVGAGALVFAAVALTGQLFAPGASTARPLAIGLAQAVALLVALWDLLLLPMRTGRSLGQALWGIRVFDRGGGRADAVAFYVRFAYKTIALLFVFPLLGYFAAPFRRDRRTLHDRLAGTVVVTRRAGLKAIVAWLALCCVAGVGAARVGPWVAMVASIYGGGYRPKVALEPLWQRQLPAAGFFSRAGVSLRGDACLVTLDSSLLALDMRTGDTLWQRAGLRSPSLAVFSGDTASPLLLLDGDSAGGWRASRLDAQSGGVLWERPLAAAVAAYSWDADTGLLVGVGRSTVYAYGQDGAPRWQRRFADTSLSLSAKVNDCVLVTFCSYQEEGSDEEDESPRCSYACLERADGRVLWELPRTDRTPLYSVGAGYEVFGDEGGRLSLVQLPQRRQVWRSTDTLGYVISALQPGGAAGPGTAVLYTARAAVAAADGRVLFSYPAATRPAALASDVLLMLPQWDASANPGAAAGTVTLLDRQTGAVRGRLARAGCIGMALAGEDSATLYLTTTVRSGTGAGARMSSVLLAASHDGRQVQEVPLGENLAAGRMRVFPAQRLLFVAAGERVGAYRLPAGSAAPPD